MQLPRQLDLHFPGFTADAFAVLERLRSNPRIEQYREEKGDIDLHVMEPFRKFRDDLVVNLVLPNHLALETERNVFSRLLKNDFGAGGCNSHVWMSFYRPDRTRLTDLQPFHGIDPDGFYSGLHVGGRDRAVLRAMHEAIAADPDGILKELNELLRAGGWTLEVEGGSGASRRRFETSREIVQLPPMTRTSTLSIYRSVTAPEVIDLGSRLVAKSAEAMVAVWPMYERFVA